jgi:hypothetical protein
MPRPAILADPPAKLGEGPSSLDLDWSAPAECPDGAAVSAEVLRLTGTAPGSRHLKARAAIRPVATGWELSLATELDGMPGERTLSAISCKSLADAAALMLALILNPDLVLKAPPPPVEQPPATPPAKRRWPAVRWRAGGYGGIQSGAIDQLSSSFALSLTIAFGPFSLRLMPSFTPPQDVFIPNREPKVGGRLWLGGAAALGCWEPALGPFTLSPCLGVDVSRLHGGGLGVLKPSDAAIYWTSAELGGFVGLPVGNRILIEVGGVGLLPFSRPKFYLDEIGEVSRPARFGWRAMGGLAWVFD